MGWAPFHRSYLHFSICIEINLQLKLKHKIKSKINSHYTSLTHIEQFESLVKILGS